MSEREIDEAREKIERFIREYIRESGASGVLVGLSGGLDSSVTAALCVSALGEDAVTALSLPYRRSDPASLTDAGKIADYLRLNLEIIDISPAVDAVLDSCCEPDKIRIGNVAARIRMVYLYDLSAERDLMVAGTGNRTEALLGYSTLWGDMACAFTPLGGLFKTQERKLAAALGLPQWIIEKTPTADLWPGQTDEGELGLSYEEADRILFALFDEGKSAGEIISAGFSRDTVERVLSLYERSHFKRRMPEYPEVSGLPL